MLLSLTLTKKMDYPMLNHWIKCDLEIRGVAECGWTFLIIYENVMLMKFKGVILGVATLPSINLIETS